MTLCFRRLFLILLTFPGMWLYADPGLVVENMVFLPKESYVGDKVELRLSVSAGGEEKLLPPREYPKSPWLTYHDISIKKEALHTEVSIVFTSYAPGTRTMPPLDLGAGVLDSVKIHTSSILETPLKEKTANTLFRGIRKPALIPGTKLFFGLVTGFLFIGPVFFLRFAGRLKKKFHLVLTMRKGRRPRKYLLKVLKDLDERKESLSSRDFYFKLSEEFRRYLSLRTGVDFIVTTSSAFGRKLEKIVGAGELQKSVSAMVQFSDSIKFGGLKVGEDRKSFDLATIREAVALVEKSVEEQVRRKGK